MGIHHTRAQDQTPWQSEHQVHAGRDTRWSEETTSGVGCFFWFPHAHRSTKTVSPKETTCRSSGIPPVSLPRMKASCLSRPQVMLEDEQTAEDGQRIADDLMQKLGIEKDQLITGAYMDLILQKQGHKVNGN